MGFIIIIIYCIYIHKRLWNFERDIKKKAYSVVIPIISTSISIICFVICDYIILIAHNILANNKIKIISYAIYVQKTLCISIA